jgi:hypothetical protein
MPLSVKEALESYGFVGEMANAIPALRSVFTRAAKEEWPVTRLNLEIRDSTWFKTYGDAARSWITLQATDPATAKRNLLNAQSKVQLMMNELGLAKNGETYEQLAKQAIIQNMDDQQLRAYLAKSGKLQYEDGVLSGNAGEMEQQMRQVARSYGQGFTSASVKSRIREVLSGTYTLEAWENLMRARAKAQYAHFADQIDMGYTVRDIADPYISTMANTLEMSETDIDLRDDWIKKALTQRDESGTNSAMPLWQFERQLKNDPRWDKTKQARNQAFDVVSQIGRDFGLVGT